MLGCKFSKSDVYNCPSAGFLFTPLKYQMGAFITLSSHLEQTNSKRPGPLKTTQGLRLPGTTVFPLTPFIPPMLSIQGSKNILVCCRELLVTATPRVNLQHRVC